MDRDLKNKTQAELEQIVVDLGQKKYLAGYIFSFIHAKGGSDISKIGSLNKDVRGRLAENGFYISKLNPVQKFRDPDGTVKYFFELTDKSRIETVLLFDKKRTTLCVSTQVGCAMHCVFCATGKLKFKRNLTSAEIVDQVIAARKDKHRVTNIVFMGMGEPLNNYEAVIKAVRILNAPLGMNFGVRHITISTAGIAEQIERLADEKIRPRLAISLNAPDDKTRNRLMPVNKRYTLRSLFKAIKIYQIKTRLRVTFEYILIKGINDKAEHAKALAKRLKNINCNVNLIEYNKHAGCSFAAVGEQGTRDFADLLEKAGIETTIRKSKGAQIKAACGQLGAGRINQKKKK